MFEEDDVDNLSYLCMTIHSSTLALPILTSVGKFECNTKDLKSVSIPYNFTTEAEYPMEKTFLVAAAMSLARKLSPDLHLTILHISEMTSNTTS